MTGVIQQMVAVIEQTYGFTLNPGSVGLGRFITHVRYLFVRIHQHQQLHEILGGRGVGRLDDEHLLPAHVLLDLDLHLAVGEPADQRLAEADAELLAHGLGQRAIRVAAEDEQVAVETRATVSSLECQATWASGRGACAPAS